LEVYDRLAHRYIERTVDAYRILDESSSFSALSSASKLQLAGICIPKVLARREMLFHEGDEGGAMYLLAQGTIQLFRTSEDGREVVIRLMKPGEMFAEAVLFERDDYPVSAVALVPSEVFLMPKRQFHCLLEQPGFRREFIANLLAKQRYLADRVYRLAAFDVETRFFSFLRDHWGEREQYTVDISKRDVAAAIDALPETLSRLLLKLRDDGTLEWEGSRLRLRKGFWKGWVGA
jgi:CRP-like cAMP-binding protein